MHVFLSGRSISTTNVKFHQQQIQHLANVRARRSDSEYSYSHCRYPTQLLEQSTTGARTTDTAMRHGKAFKPLPLVIISIDAGVRARPVAQQIPSPPKNTARLENMSHDVLVATAIVVQPTGTNAA